MARLSQIWPVLVLLGCGAAGDDGVAREAVDSDAGGSDGAGEVTGEARWEVALEGLAGALLGVTTVGDEVWAVGADPGDGEGPMIVHGRMGGGWERIDARAVDPAGGHLWWVFAPGDGARMWMVGEGGRVLTVARDGGEVARVESGTDATLYGIWGASEEVLWAVGGYVAPRRGPPTIVRLTAAGSEVIALPEGLAGAEGTFFKVWGASADAVWVVGERGMVARWDGLSWRHVPIDGEPRLVTVHGHGEALVAVGGGSAGVIVEGAGFEGVDVGAVAPLNGVFVEPDGAAWAVGMLGLVMRRQGVGGAWQTVASGVARSDWHAVHVDARGDVWVVGGDLLSRLDRGTLTRFGPVRDDLPRGEVEGLEPLAEEEVEAGPEVVEVVEQDVIEVVEQDVLEVVEQDVVEQDVVEVVEEEVVDEDVVEAVDIVEEVEEVVVPDVSEIADASDASEGDGDVQTADDGGDVVVAADLEIGEIDYATGIFTALADGDPLGIVHGPQGGVHLEVALRFSCESDALEVAAALEIYVEVDGVVCARYLAPQYPVPVIAAGVCQSYVVPLIFDELDAAPYAGKVGKIEAVVRPPGGALRRVLKVSLFDTL